MDKSVVEVSNLSKIFLVRRRGRRKKDILHAVSNISFTVNHQEVLGIVGESGCGKSTLARLILRLIEPSSGQIKIDNEEILSKSPRELREFRKNMQMVFQDPTGSLNPTMSVGQTVMETLRFHNIGVGDERREIVLNALKTVGLSSEHFHRLPHQLSGGQNQRVGIARAIVVHPKLLVLDEPVSALDVSVQAQVLKLLEDLRSNISVSMMFISHDLGVVRRVSDRIIVLYLGRVMEISPVEDLFNAPMHPYTRGLLAARPVFDPTERIGHAYQPLRGDLPSPFATPKGCAFASRCKLARDRCMSEVPQLTKIEEGRQVACFAIRERW